MQRGSWAYIYGNTTHDGPIRIGPRGEATEPNTTTTQYVVVENNKIYNYQMNIMPGTKHLIVRDNVMYENNQTAINVEPTDPQGRNIADVWIIGNTVYNTGTSGRFFRSDAGIPSRSITIGENTYAAGNLSGGSQGTAGMYISESSLSGFRAIYNNVWPTMQTNTKYAQNGVMWVFPSYSGQTGFKDATEWLAYAQVTGDVFRDF